MLFINSQEPSKKKKKKKLIMFNYAFFKEHLKISEVHLKVQELAISSEKKNEIYKIFQNKFQTNIYFIYCYIFF